MSLRLRILAAFAYGFLLILVALEVPLALNLRNRVDAEVRNDAAGQAPRFLHALGFDLALRGEERFDDRGARRGCPAFGGARLGSDERIDHFGDEARRRALVGEDATDDRPSMERVVIFDGGLEPLEDHLSRALARGDRAAIALRDRGAREALGPVVERRHQKLAPDFWSTAAGFVCAGAVAVARGGDACTCWCSAGAAFRAAAGAIASISVCAVVAYGVLWRLE